MFCSSCGYKNEDHSKYCSACGKPQMCFSSSNLTEVPGYLEMGESVSKCFNNYATFTGRASRSEYWWFVLFYYLIAVGAGMLAGMMDASLNTESALPASILILLVFLVPSLSVYVRRLHDVNKSGWNILWGLTVIGLIPLFYWTCKRGDEMRNNY